MTNPWHECGRYGSILGGEVVQCIGAGLDEDGWTRVRVALELR